VVADCQETPVLKQIGTTYDLFQLSIHKELDEVLKEYHGHRYKIGQREEVVGGFTIYDKSRYVFRKEENWQKFLMENRKGYFRNDNEANEIDTKANSLNWNIKKAY